mmetsp:Transcript_49339/g.145719  ORF Transcript_49339/g.145719 Transcript_49339/m.145719 type:complete len:107 (+) Transcript_49339:104-424(+)
MPPKVRPDFLITKGIQKEDQYIQAAKYAKSLDRIQQNSSWFEGKVKYDFADNEKRSVDFVKAEMDACNEELKIRRRTRLRALYEGEARQWEEELAHHGLAVQRQHY